MQDSKYADAVCSHKHSFALDNFLRKLLQSPRRIVGPYIKNGDTVFDLGCGPGFFSLPMGEMVGDTGKVIAVDLQEEMLDIVAEKISDTKLAARISMHRCKEDSLYIHQSHVADFILAYYMIHETPDTRKFLAEVKQLLKPGGKFLIVEPRFHVRRKTFTLMHQIAIELGFKTSELPRWKGGMSVLLTH